MRIERPLGRAVLAGAAAAALGTLVVPGTAFADVTPSRSGGGCSSWTGGNVANAGFAWADPCISYSSPNAIADAYFHVTQGVPGGCQIRVSVGSDTLGTAGILAYRWYDCPTGVGTHHITPQVTYGGTASGLAGTPPEVCIAWPGHAYVCADGPGL